MENLVIVLTRLLRDIAQFCQHASGLKLRSYQEEAARAILESVIHKRGDTIVVVFPRQSGKNELQAQIEAYLLTLYSQLDAEMVKVSPTWKPQSLNAMRRIERVLNRNLITRDRWRKESGYIYKLGAARIFFLSGSPTANVVGATANVILECDEAQDVHIAKWDKDFAPMAASTNATKVFWGTAWTSQTLLARELRAAQKAEKQDGRRRVFLVNAQEVSEEVPAYKNHVAEQVAKLGRNHPLIKTQYFCEEIEAEGGMFPQVRMALMQGCHPAISTPQEDEIYALLIDVAGEDESCLTDSGEELASPGRDSTALTVVEVDLSSLSDDLIRAPTYRVVQRYLWTGEKHTSLYGQLKALAEHWRAHYVVIDATGVGAGLASFLGKALPGKVLPFVFTSKSKSDLGWNYLAIIETGRYKEYRAEGLTKQKSLQELFWQQVGNCQMEILEGAGKLMRWGVPVGRRDPLTGDLVHDDLLISASLTAVLDEQSWGIAKSKVIKRRDILSGMSEAF